MARRSNNEVIMIARNSKTNRRTNIVPMLRLAPGASPLLTQRLGGGLRPRPPHFECANDGLRLGRYAAGAGTSNLAQKLAQRSLAGRMSNTTTPGKQPVWEAGRFKCLIRAPLKRGRLTTSKTNAPASLASYPRKTTAALPSCVHA